VERTFLDQGRVSSWIVLGSGLLDLGSGKVGTGKRGAGWMDDGFLVGTEVGGQCLFLLGNGNHDDGMNVSDESCFRK